MVPIKCISPLPYPKRLAASVVLNIFVPERMELRLKRPSSHRFAHLGPDRPPGLLYFSASRTVSRVLLPPPRFCHLLPPFLPVGPSGHTTRVAPKQQLLTSVLLRNGQGNPGASTGACTSLDSFSPLIRIGCFGCSVSPARSAGAVGPSASSGSSSAGVLWDTRACTRHSERCVPVLRAARMELPHGGAHCALTLPREGTVPIPPKSRRIKALSASRHAGPGPIRFPSTKRDQLSRPSTLQSPPAMHDWATGIRGREIEGLVLGPGVELLSKGPSWPPSCQNVIAVAFPLFMPASRM
ncbi:hypothetical protein NDU88_006200 [Pleurodeles waltl]|uniref:Uncharacterized protein n=1 Tax=Pleurodeles waltl TaxID=8319 RepID=A0AAV7TXT3_PLEWA|nr:hypothetical protein NDU88_006200 [Pleurodeles waltl]